MATPEIQYHRGALQHINTAPLARVQLYVISYNIYIYMITYIVVLIEIEREREKENKMYLQLPVPHNKKNNNANTGLINPPPPGR